jgi:hypothetical protein
LGKVCRSPDTGLPLSESLCGNYVASEAVPCLFLAAPRLQRHITADATEILCGGPHKISQIQFADSGSFVTARQSIGSTNAAGVCGREVSLSFAGMREQGITQRRTCGIASRDLPAKRLSGLTVRQVLPGNDLHLPIIWTSYQFPLAFPSYNLKLSQSKVKT